MTIADKLTLLTSSKESIKKKLDIPNHVPFHDYHEFMRRSDFTIYDLFAGGKQGVWYDPSDKSTLFQDVAGIIPVTKDGDPIGLMKDKSGNGNHATQSISAARPLYKTDGVFHWFDTDGVNDHFKTNYIPSTDWVAAIAYKAKSTPSSFIFESLNSGVYLYLSGDGTKLSTSGSGSDKHISRTDVTVGNTYSVVVGCVGTSPMPYSPITLGGRVSGSSTSFLFKGSVNALVICDGLSSVDDRISLGSYLAKKSGVAL